jgi:hypothetical protein
VPSCGGYVDAAAADNNNNKYCYWLLGFTANFEILRSSLIVRSSQLEIPRGKLYSVIFSVIFSFYRQVVKAMNVSLFVFSSSRSFRFILTYSWHRLLEN